uniref:SAC domain-containing protein n=1 Tax=Fagus sylvatica TaxID=28930 RepID=A0A2N9EI01_FAGSY
MMERADSSQKLYTRMRLWEFPDQYIVEPTDGSCGSSLAISRKDGSMNLIDELPECSTVRVPKIRTIFGVVGMLKLLAGSYLIVITERECVGSYLGHPIFKVSYLKIFPCDHSLENSPAEQKKMETEFFWAAKYCREDFCAQRLNDLGDESKLLPLWRQAEPRFLWNNYMLEVLIDNKVSLIRTYYLLSKGISLSHCWIQLFACVALECIFYSLVVHLNAGWIYHLSFHLKFFLNWSSSFHNFQAAIGKDIIDVTLVARRCSRRNGTRMWRRGADSDGYVANFVESEQIMQFNGFTASFVQIRGSIPLLWEQIVDLTYKPKFQLVRLEEAPRVVERHILDLRKKYGAVLAVDLVNTHGGEGRLSEKFANAMQHVVSDDVRYLLLNEKGEKMKEQLGVMRTNCIDCLDRTNVTQSMIGRKMLEYQLRRLGVFGAEETISSHPNFDESFKILWANHGDEISLQYSGTPALKGDFVRYGQRTIQGILKDGWNSLLRYYLNNFCDGTKQDAIDLLQGHYIVSVGRDMTPSSQKGGLEAVASFPLALSLVLTGFLFATMSLRQGRYELRHFFFSFMWASLSVVLAVFVRANGRIFCNRPRLHKPS